MSGTLTLKENIADNGGLNAAYLAYHMWQAKYGDEPRLPSLESYTPKQMFWISYGHSLSAKYRSDNLRDLIGRKPHAIGEFRVIGSLQNRPEFARDFDCPARSVMNPATRCHLWR